MRKLVLLFCVCVSNVFALSSERIEELKEFAYEAERLGIYELAVETYELLLELAEDDPDVLDVFTPFELADILWEVGDRESALEIYEILTCEFEEKAQFSSDELREYLFILWRRCFHYGLHGDEVLCASDFEKIMELDPDFSTLYLDMSVNAKPELLGNYFTKITPGGTCCYECAMKSKVEPACHSCEIEAMEFCLDMCDDAHAKLFAMARQIPDHLPLKGVAYAIGAMVRNIAQDCCRSGSNFYACLRPYVKLLGRDFIEDLFDDDEEEDITLVYRDMSEGSASRLVGQRA